MGPHVEIPLEHADTPEDEVIEVDALGLDQVVLIEAVQQCERALRGGLGDRVELVDLEHPPELEVAH